MTRTRRIPKNHINMHVANNHNQSLDNSRYHESGCWRIGLSEHYNSQRVEDKKMCNILRISLHFTVIILMCENKK